MEETAGQTGINQYYSRYIYCNLEDEPQRIEFSLAVGGHHHRIDYQSQ